MDKQSENGKSDILQTNEGTEMDRGEWGGRSRDARGK